jgi:phospho-N-acetylmuramoyl-pentapeptide-transferase
MPIEAGSLIILKTAILYGLVACFLAFLWAPILIQVLYRFKLVRSGAIDPTLSISERRAKAGTPVMGGLLVILTVAVITISSNWDRQFTWVPISVMLLSALLGGIDDVLNILGRERGMRSLKHTWRLISVHKQLRQRVWLFLTLPWTAFKRLSIWIGSKPGRGVHVHEKLVLQFLAGGISAWWIYFKLSEQWRTIHLPFDGFINIGWFIIPLIILFVMFTSNAVNVADGMDGLAGGSLIITFTALTILSWLFGYKSITYVNASTVGALLAYTYFNIKPARFQMGDVGSLGLGALLAINTIVINRMILLPFLGFIFYLELLTVIVQLIGRYFLGRRLFKMAPLHHHMELMGWSEEKTVMRFWVLHAAVVLLGVWIALY